MPHFLGGSRPAHHQHQIPNLHFPQPQPYHQYQASSPFYASSYYHSFIQPAAAVLLYDLQFPQDHPKPLYYDDINSAAVKAPPPTTHIVNDFASYKPYQDQVLC